MVNTFKIFSSGLLQRTQHAAVGRWPPRGTVALAADRKSCTGVGAASKRLLLVGPGALAWWSCPGSNVSPRTHQTLSFPLLVASPRVFGGAWASVTQLLLWLKKLGLNGVKESAPFGRLSGGAGRTCTNGAGSHACTGLLAPAPSDRGIPRLLLPGCARPAVVRGHRTLPSAPSVKHTVLQGIPGRLLLSFRHNSYSKLYFNFQM